MKSRIVKSCLELSTALSWNCDLLSHTWLAALCSGAAPGWGRIVQQDSGMVSVLPWYHWWSITLHYVCVYITGCIYIVNIPQLQIKIHVFQYILYLLCMWINKTSLDITGHCFACPHHIVCLSNCPSITKNLSPADAKLYFLADILHSNCGNNFRITFWKLFNFSNTSREPKGSKPTEIARKRGTPNCY